MKRVFCDFSDIKGTIKPQHGFINFPEGMTAHFGRENSAQCNPVTGSPDSASAEEIDRIFKEIGMPFVRLRDPKTAGYGKRIDIPYVFRDYKKDPDDPKNWYLKVNDDYLKGLANWPHGEVIFRLGAPREQWAPIFNNKPDDYDKFSRICVNYVKHLNEGWADGLHLGIRYFEIWERADDPKCWSNGTALDYYELYGKVACALKKEWPELKVGGPSAAECGGDNAFLKGFLDYVKENKIPCDFITWNYYGENPSEAIRQAKEVRNLVRKAGLLKQVEIMNTGWNCLTEDEEGYFVVPNVCNMHGAAFGAAFMIGMQKAGMDGSMYFECLKSVPWGGLVQHQFIKAYKPLYSFQAFAKLYKHKNEAAIKTVGNNIYALASSDETGSAVITSIYQKKNDEVLFETGCSEKKAVYILDEGKDLRKLFETSEENFTVKIEGYTVIFVETVN